MVVGCGELLTLSSEMEGVGKGRNREVLASSREMKDVDEVRKKEVLAS